MLKKILFYGLLVAFIVFIIDKSKNDAHKIQSLESKVQILKNELNDINQTLELTKQKLDATNDKVKNLKISLINDIDKYHHLDIDERNKILASIWMNSKKYEVDPTLLYAILWKESRFRNDVTHTPVFVRALNKKVQAQGMGAIIWEFWDEYLIANTTLKSKNDLNVWEKNIEATASIISYLSQKPLAKNTKNINESVAARYYGKYQKNYVTKVISKMEDIKSGIYG